MVKPTHSEVCLWGVQFLQRCGAGRQCNSNILTFRRTGYSQKCYFTSILFWHLVVPQLPAQLLAHRADGDGILLWLDPLCDLVWELDYREESQIISATGALLGEENQWRDVLHRF